MSEHKSLRSMTTRELLQKAERIHYQCTEGKAERVAIDGKLVEKDRAMREVVRMYDAVLGVLLRHDARHDSWQPLFRLGTVLQEMGYPATSIILLEMASQVAPETGFVWNNLGVAYRAASMEDKAEEAFKKAVDVWPEDPNPSSNIGGLLINTGRPEDVISWSDRALALDANHAQSRWHKALGLLELQRWGEAWPYHEARHIKGSNCDMAFRNYHGEKRVTPWWDGKTKARVVIHGEQGLGDEIMFASCLRDAIATGAELIVECAPRNENLFRSSFPSVRMVGTHETDGHEWIPEVGMPDYKSALGSLPQFYRTREQDFPKLTYLKPNPEKRRKWRDQLDRLGRWPKVGIAWQGGHFNTRVDLRSIYLPNLALVMDQKCNFVSLQYTKAAADEIKKSGFKIAHWPAGAEAEDLEEVAALIAELDLVITVCQTAVHLAGGIGTPCWVMTPAAPAWRYAVGTRTDMAWYGPHVELIRQQKGEDWAPVIIEVARRLDGWCAAKRKAA